MNKLIFCIIVLFSTNAYAQSCLPGGITFQSQTEISQFPSLYPLCQVIEGDVTIDASNQSFISNLDSLSSIVSIQGNLKIRSNSLGDLEGLHNLTSIDGQLEIAFNNNLADLTGLNELVSIGSNLVITNNSDLENLVGLENLVSIGGDFIVKSNNSFITSVGTSMLERVGGDLEMQSNLIVQTTGLENLNFVGGDFLCSHNFNTPLSDFTGFENLDTIAGSLRFDYLHGLESYNGFDNLKYIGGNLDLAFTDVDSIRLTDFPNLNKIEGSLDFNSCSSKSIRGFNSLKRIGGELKFLDLSHVNDISGFESLEIVDSLFSIAECRFLKTIPDFNSLTHCGGILIGEFESTSGDGNDDLISLAGFENLLTVEENLIIGRNHVLDFIDGFNALTHVGGDLGLIRNGFSAYIPVNAFHAIQHIGGNFYLNEQFYDHAIAFDFLAYVGGDLIIKGSISPAFSFPMLERVEGNFSVTNGVTLDSLSDLTSLRYIGGDFIIEELYTLGYLDDCPLLDSIGGDFIIHDNANLRTISGFDQLSYVGGSMAIYGHENFSDTSLTTIPEFNALVHIGGALSISTNDDLTSITGFNNIPKTKNLSIVYNPALKELNGFEALQKVDGGLRLENSFQTSLDAFHQLDSIIGQFNYNNAAQFVGFEELEYVGDWMTLSSLNLNASNQFNQLNHIGGTLSLNQLNADVPINILNEVLHVGERIEIKSVQVQTLNVLEKLNTINGRLEIRDNTINNLNALNKISQITEGFYFMDNDDLNQMGPFSNLNAIEGIFTCQRNSGSFDFEFLNQLSSIGDDVIFERNNGLLTFNGLQNLTTINGSLSIDDHYNLTEVSALANLQSINGSLTITDNRELISLIGLHNIDPLSINSNSTSQFVDDLEITFNDSLSICSIRSICEYLRLPDMQTTIHLNADGCHSSEEIMCQAFGLSGEVFYDNNQNGIKDSNDYGIGNRSIEFQPNNLIIYTDEHGQYYEFADSGSIYTINYIDHPDWILTSDSISYTHNFFPGNPENLQNDYGVYPTFDEHKGEISILSNPTRCNTDVQFYLKMKNEGTYFESGDLILQIDPRCDFVEASPAPTTVDLIANTITWTRDSLAPFQAFDPLITLAMPDETFTGDTLSFTSTWNSTNSTLSIDNSYEPEVRCSYDPNDKLAMPLGVYEENYALIADTFEYTVRFQNTGNDYAIDVSIFDTISTQFDINSFRVLNSSHPVEVRRIDNAVEFLFNEIYLPDSLTNEPGSHGFVSYSILPKEDTPNFTLVENTAFIVFDFNPAIVTNTTSHNLVDTIPLITNINEEIAHSLSVYPSPTTGKFYISGLENSPNKQIIIYNTLGQVIQISEAISFDLSDQNSGIYWIKVIVDDKIYTLNILKSS